MIICDDEITELAKYIKAHYGVNLVGKNSLVRSRLSFEVEKKGFHSLTDYFKYSLNDKSGQEFANILNKLTTNYTYFMREAGHFDFLVKTALGDLEKNVLRNKDLRIWNAACSTGEEPYTIAMFVDDYFDYRKNDWDAKILATDISEKVLDISRKALYDAASVAKLPALFKEKYIETVDSKHVRICKKIRDEVIFHKFNLLSSSFSFKKPMHIIFCRNVLIYFDKDTKENVIDKLCNCLERGGYIFFGHSEPISGHKRLDRVGAAVYKKK